MRLYLAAWLTLSWNQVERMAGFQKAVEWLACCWLLAACCLDEKTNETRQQSGDNAAVAGLQSNNWYVMKRLNELKDLNDRVWRSYQPVCSDALQTVQWAISDAQETTDWDDNLPLLLLILILPMCATVNATFVALTTHLSGGMKWVAMWVSVEQETACSLNAAQRSCSCLIQCSNGSGSSGSTVKLYAKSRLLGCFGSCSPTFSTSALWIVSYCNFCKAICCPLSFNVHLSLLWQQRQMASRRWQTNWAASDLVFLSGLFEYCNQTLLLPRTKSSANINTIYAKKVSKEILSS